MPRAKPLPVNMSIPDISEEWDYFPGDDSEPGEYKRESWGILKGRALLIDYHS